MTREDQIQAIADTRAKHLREFADDAYKLNEECFAEFDVWFTEDSDADPPRANMPWQYATRMGDGSSTWIAFSDSPDHARADAENAIGNDYPMCPDVVIDLDTGARMSCVTKVFLVDPATLQLACQASVKLNERGAPAPSVILEALGMDEDARMSVCTEGDSQLDMDDPDNETLDFCGGVMLKRLPRAEPEEGHLFEWEVEFY